MEGYDPIAELTRRFVKRPVETGLLIFACAFLALILFLLLIAWPLVGAIVWAGVFYVVYGILRQARQRYERRCRQLADDAERQDAAMTNDDKQTGTYGRFPPAV